MTYLQLVNAVLRRLREDEVTSYDDTAYSTLIGDFVNQAKREVEDSWKWTSLRSSISINTSASTYTYSLTGAIDRSRILHVINDTEDVVMSLVDNNYIHNLLNLGTTQEAAPIYYTFYGQVSDVPQIQVWPIPDNVYTLKFFGVFPQSDLSNNSTELTVPDLPVILGAYALALSERGEDGGNRFDETMALYDKALGDYIAMDAVKVPMETDAEVC